MSPKPIDGLNHIDTTLHTDTPHTDATTAHVDTPHVDTPGGHTDVKKHTDVKGGHVDVTTVPPGRFPQ
jgi:hypothetical protein